MKKVVLKDEKLSVILSGHPWIFSGAIASHETLEPGELVHVVDMQGAFLALAYAHPAQSLFARILSYQDVPIKKLLSQRLKNAYQLRKQAGLFTITNAYRLINAEGDQLSGLIIDVYGHGCVIQISTLGMERLKPLILELLKEEFDFKWIIEKSESSSRELEGLGALKMTHLGSPPSYERIFEGNVSFKVDLEKGQKTGFFLDQRSMRLYLKTLASDLNVLNMFAYTGGFSLAALSHGAKKVTSVDRDKKALSLLDSLLELNHFNKDTHESVCQDAFEFLHKTDLSVFDLIILDPPAFAKKRGDIDAASCGYKRLFIDTLSKMKSGAFLYAASCSYFIDEKLFEKLLLQAAMETGTLLKCLTPQIETLDHPRLLAHKEGRYLKGFVMQVFKR